MTVSAPFLKNRKLKFSDCKSCRFHNRIGRHANPICGDCDSGEFYEERRAAPMTANELINEFRDLFDE